MAMVLGTKTQYQKALNKARKLGTARTVRHIGTSRAYLVHSSTEGLNYVVGRTAEGEYECSCTAGKRGIPCYHSAGLYLALVGEQMGARIPKANRLDGQEVRL